MALLTAPSLRKLQDRNWAGGHARGARVLRRFRILEVDVAAAVDTIVAGSEGREPGYIR